MLRSRFWSHFVWNEDGELFPFAQRRSSATQRTIEPPFDRDRHPALAKAFDAWADGSLLRKRRGSMLRDTDSETESR